MSTIELSKSNEFFFQSVCLWRQRAPERPKEDVSPVVNTLSWLPSSDAATAEWVSRRHASSAATGHISGDGPGIFGCFGSLCFTDPHVGDPVGWLWRLPRAILRLFPLLQWRCRWFSSSSSPSRPGLLRVLAPEDDQRTPDAQLPLGGARLSIQSADRLRPLKAEFHPLSYSSNWKTNGFLFFRQHPTFFLRSQ